MGVYKTPKILKYITKYYPNHFISAPEISILEHIPLKFSYLNLEHVAAYRYASHIEYLSLKRLNLRSPCEGGWNDYKEILSFFPNLKGIRLGWYSNLDSLSLANQNIWRERIAYFESQNIAILSNTEYSEIISEFRKLSPSWTFKFT